MKKQVVFIHGGGVFETYDAFLKDLESFTVDPFEEKKRWRMTLKEDLGTKYEVFLPEMPNKLNAKYKEWEIWFEKYIPFLDDGVILIGHSLGASFFLKFFSENELPVSVQALYLIAAPYFTQTQKDGGDFRFDESALSVIAQKVEEVVLMHSEDDNVVPFDNMLKLKKRITDARTMKFSDRRHFLQESFPELIEDIKGLN